MKRKVFRLIILTLLLSPISGFAQQNLVRVNVSFNSYFDFDSSVYVARGNDYVVKSNPSTILSIHCFDHDVAPDSVKLHKYFKDQVRKIKELKKDSAAFDSSMRQAVATTDLGRINLTRGFYGLYKKQKLQSDDGIINSLDISTFNYDEHCYCEFQFKRNFGSDSASLEDTAAINEFVDRLVTRSMNDVRAENQRIRDTYRIRIDTLPLENYWIRVYNKDGKLTRDSIFMDDLDSIDFKPKFTFYNITYRANLIVEPHLEHEYVDFYLDKLKGLEHKGDTFYIEIRDAEAGIISRRGTITINNSLGYPIDLPFYISYKNHLYERLRRTRN